MSLQYYTDLILLSMISFGSHFCHSSLSIFGAFFIEDHLVSAFGLSALFAASFLTSVFLPLCVGYMIDQTHHLQWISISLLLTATLGQIAFVTAICRKNFWMAIVAQVLFGSGASSVSAVQRVSVSLYLKDNLTFSTGFYVAVAGLSKLLGKITVGPIAYDLESYKKTLWLSVALCALSLFCYIVFLLKLRVNPQELETSPPKRNAESSPGADQLPSRFSLLATLHTVYILVFHLLQGFTPHLATVEWHESIVDAGFIAGISPLMTIFIAPIVGVVTNRYNNKMMLFSVVAGVLVVIGYSVLIFSSVDPILPLLLIALAQAALPTLILAAIAVNLASCKATGLAFGIIEALDGMANVAGNLIFGYLYSVTGSHFTGLLSLLVLASIGVCIFLFLYFEERIQCPREVDDARTAEVVDSGIRYEVSERESLVIDKITRVDSYGTV